MKTSSFVFVAIAHLFFQAILLLQNGAVLGQKIQSNLYMNYRVDWQVDNHCGTLRRDSTQFQCYSCPANQEVDPATKGDDGDMEGCRCMMGYYSGTHDCSSVSFRVRGFSFLVYIFCVVSLCFSKCEKFSLSRF